MYTVYSKPACPACDQAKALLKQQGLPYQEIILDVGQPKQEQTAYVAREELLQKFPSARTMPQITFGDKYLGGVHELRSFITSGGV